MPRDEFPNSISPNTRFRAKKLHASIYFSCSIIMCVQIYSILQSISSDKVKVDVGAIFAESVPQKISQFAFENEYQPVRRISKFDSLLQFIFLIFLLFSWEITSSSARQCNLAIVSTVSGSSNNIRIVLIESAFQQSRKRSIVQFIIRRFRERADVPR